MSAWSQNIAAFFVDLGREDRRAFDQLQLQNLVYLANGWCLAILGQPLTKDLPQALPHGPIYQRLARTLASSGLAPVVKLDGIAPHPADRTPNSRRVLATEFEPKQRDIMMRVYNAYADFTATELFALTRRGDSPWKRVFDDQDEPRDIPHALMKAQFVSLASQSA